MIQSSFFFALLIIASLAFVAVLAPFFEPILWATTLAILFQPVQRVYVKQAWGPLHSCCPMHIADYSDYGNCAGIVYFCGSCTRGYRSLSVDRQWRNRYFRPAFLGAKHVAFFDGTRGEGLGVNLEEIKQKLSASALQGSQWVASHLFTFGQNTLAFYHYVLFDAVLVVFLFTRRQTDH